MITLERTTSNLHLERHLSLNDVLHATLKGGNEVSYYGQEIVMSEQVGNATLDTSKLLYYPTLCDLLRKMKDYPLYTMKLNVEKLAGINDYGIEATINSLKNLNQLLTGHRQKKSLLDAKVNNLIMLYGQNKIMPIYQSSKLYRPEHNNWCRIKSRIIRISGISYFNWLPEGKHQSKKRLYYLCAHDLLKTHVEENQKNYNDYYDYDLRYIKGFIGGIINTPILVFRCAQSHLHKGKRYYLDLHTNQLLNKLKDVRELAQSYAGNSYRFDIFEDES